MNDFFIGNGIKIEKRGDRYYLIYDAGEICDRMEEIEITGKEADIAMKSSEGAYDIIIKYQNMMNE